MKKIIIITLTSVMAISMFSRCGGSSSPKNELDSLSYIVGLDFGRFVKEYDSTLNVAMIANAIQDVLDNKVKIDDETARMFQREYHYVRLPKRAKEAEEKFFAEVQKSNKNLQRTESGLMYEIIEKGDQTIETLNTLDKVKVKYEGKLKDGKVFDSSYDKNEEGVDLMFGSVITGWQEGLKLIGKGGKIKLYIPGELAYGPRGQRQAGIGANEPLVFDVELVDVIPYEDKEN